MMALSQKQYRPVRPAPHTFLSQVTRRPCSRLGACFSLLLLATQAGAQVPENFPTPAILRAITDPASGSKRPITARFDTGLELARQSYAETRGNVPAIRQRL